jgi:hypothetical protein
MMSETVYKGKELTYYNMQFSYFCSSIGKIPVKNSSDFKPEIGT